MHALTVDYTNKSATISTVEFTGLDRQRVELRVIRIWSGVPSRTAAETRAAADGWVKIDDWALTSPPDGFYCHVRPAMSWEPLPYVYEFAPGELES